ncbi:MAG: right-handed parallel beta-helix repeat-containing protein, partial [Candidatus Thorarchaeota archaeon]
MRFFTLIGPLCVIILLQAPIYNMTEPHLLQKTTPIMIEEERSTTNLVDHGPIIINSDSEFISMAADEGWPGTGSKEDPIIIEGLSIVAENRCIDISNTQVYFIISRCSVNRTNPALSDYAILLSSVLHASVIDCIIISGTGMKLEDCPEAVIRGNSITWELRLAGSDSCEVAYNRDLTLWVTYSDDCVFRGNSPLRTVILDSSRNCTFADNVLENYEWENGGVGIRIDGGDLAWNHSFSNNSVNGRPIGYYYNVTNEKIDCTSYGLVLLGVSVNVTLYNGVFSDVNWPIYMSHCVESVVESCLIQGGDAGVHISNSENCSIIHNIFDRVRYAVNLYYSIDTLIENNTMSGLGMYEDGIGVWGQSSSHRCLIISNRIQYFGTAVYLGGTDDCIVIRNHLIDNNVAVAGYSNNCTIHSNYVCHNRFGSYLRSSSNFRQWNNTFGWNVYQSLDDEGVNNEWDDGTGIGNQWTDYNGSGVYRISGTSNSVDRFPSVYVDMTPPTILLHYSPLVV